MFFTIESACQRYQLDRRTLYSAVDFHHLRLYKSGVDDTRWSAPVPVTESERRDVIHVVLDGDLNSLAEYAMNGIGHLLWEDELLVDGNELEALLAGRAGKPEALSAGDPNSALADEASALLKETAQRRDAWSESIQSMILESIRLTGRIPKTPSDVLQSLPDDISRLGVEISGKGSLTKYRRPGASEPLSQNAMSKRLTLQLKILATLAGC